MTSSLEVTCSVQLSYGGERGHPTQRAPADVRRRIQCSRTKRHHTKDKGDLGVAKAHADLVAYADGRFHRVQVKYRAARCGAVNVRFRSLWSDRDGTHVKPIDKGSIDAVPGGSDRW